MNKAHKSKCDKQQWKQWNFRLQKQAVRWINAILRQKWSLSMFASVWKILWKSLAIQTHISLGWNHQNFVELWLICFNQCREYAFTHSPHEQIFAINWKRISSRQIHLICVDRLLIKNGGRPYYFRIFEYININGGLTHFHE